MTNALIYPRISQEGQSTYSISTQIEAAKVLAVQRGYTVAGVFADEYSGEELDRPAWSALLDAIPSTGAKVVLVHDIDRLGREVYIQAIHEHEIEQAGARVEFVLEDYAGDSGQLLKAIKGGLAQYENRQRVERSRRGKNGRVAAGQVIIPTGRAPYGYEYHVPAKGQGELRIRDDQAAIVRQMFTWLTVHRLSSYEIARRLHADGVPSLGDLTTAVRKKSGHAEWSPSSVRKLFANPVYKGEWFWGKTRRVKQNGRKVQVPQPESDWVRVAVPAIVDGDTWDEAQACIAANAARTYRIAGREYMLRGMVFCPCGRRWTGRYKNHLDRAYYRCPSTEREGWRKACLNRFGIRQETLEAGVWQYVFGELLHPDRLTAELERQQADAAQQTAKREQRRKAIDAAIKAVDRKLEILVGQALDGLPGHIIENRKQAILAERRDLEDQQAREQAVAESAGITPATIATLQTLATEIQAAEPHLTPQDRRQILTLLRLRADVIDPKTVRVSGLISGAVLDLSPSSHHQDRPSIAVPFAAELTMRAA